MKALLLRLLPFVIAVAAALAAFMQWRFSSAYCWPLAVWLLAYVAASVALVWGRLRVVDAIEKIVPSFLALAAIGVSFLVVESDLQRWALTVTLSGISLLVLELLFLLTRDGAKYPVNGISRVNLTLVPVAAFFFAVALNAFYVFLRWPWWITTSIFTALGALAYLLTAHPTAERRHRRRWFWLGGLVGMHAGVLAVLLPVGLMVHGALAALFVALPLRVRRYAYQPVPSKTHAWIEGALSLIAFIALLATSRWA